MSKASATHVIAGSATNKEVTKIKLRSAKPKLRFDISSYYFIELFALVILGFWPSYFVKFFNGTANFTFYFQFHATVMILWIFIAYSSTNINQEKEIETS